MKNKRNIIWLTAVMIIVLVITPVTYSSSIAEHNLEIGLKKEFDLKNLSLGIKGSLNNSDLSLQEFYTEFNDLFLEGRLCIEEAKFTVGRKNISTGPGRFSQLMMSAKGPSLDMLLLETEHRYFKARQMLAFLGEGVNKQLFVHRIENSSFIPRLTIGLSEAMMASKVIHPGFYIPVPVLPYYLTKKLVGINSIYDDNSDNYIGIDFTYNINDKSSLYGELLVDEYPMLPRYDNPKKTAQTLGIDYYLKKDFIFAAEFSNVGKNLYYHRYARNKYFYKDKFIGHWVGSDADVLDLALTKNLKKDRSVTINFQLVKRGNDNYLVRQVDKNTNKKITYQNEVHLKLGYQGKYIKHVKYSFLTDFALTKRDNGSYNDFTINCNTEISF